MNQNNKKIAILTTGLVPSVIAALAKSANCEVIAVDAIKKEEEIKPPAPPNLYPKICHPFGDDHKGPHEYVLKDNIWMCRFCGQGLK